MADLMEDGMTGEKFIKLHLKSAEHSFWDERHKASVIRAIERTYQRGILRDYGIADITIHGDQVLIKWYKRHIPLTDEELKEQYGE